MKEFNLKGPEKDVLVLPLFNLCVHLISSSVTYFTQPILAPGAACNDHQNGIPDYSPFSPHPRETAHQAATRGLFLKLRYAALLVWHLTMPTFIFPALGCYIWVCFSHNPALCVKLHHHISMLHSFPLLAFLWGNTISTPSCVLLLPCLYHAASPYLFSKIQFWRQILLEASQAQTSRCFLPLVQCIV